MAERPEIPASLYRLMADIGPEWGRNIGANVRLMIEKFSEVLRHSPKDGVEVRKNISYGQSPRQALDLYLPQDGRRDRAVLVFVHGGAFVEGERNRSDEIYSNILYYFSRAGLVGVNMGYRLADEARYPEASMDVGAVLRWVREHADELGVNPAALFLMGHSAGGAHVGSYAYDRRVHGPGGHGLAGLIIVSGRVRADNRSDNPNAAKVEAYYGPDASRYNDVSPVSHVNAGSVATFIAMAEFENPLLDVYCLELAHRLAAAKGRAPPIMWLRGHNHTSIIGHINTAEDRLGQGILAFINRRLTEISGERIA